MISMWQVEISKKADKKRKKLNRIIQEQLYLLIEEMELNGPIRGNWPNFSQHGKNLYHCHLKKGRPTYIACWIVINKKMKLIEVNYVGTHEKAPY